jgi:hypothetical protein
MEKGNLRKTTIVRMRNYGRIIQDMVQLAVKEDDTAKQQSMIIYIAQCMRQKNAIWNREQESGVERLKDDISVLSQGLLKCDFPEFDEMMQCLALHPIPNADRLMVNKKKKK